MKIFNKTQEEWKDIIEDIKYDFLHLFIIDKMRIFYYSVINGVPNIFKWTKIIWKDRNWDYNYIFYILQFKFENMEKFFNSDKAMTISSKRRAKEIMVAKNLCKRISSNQYLDNALIDYYRKYGYEFKFEFEFESCEDNSKYKRLIDNNTKEQDDLFFKAGEHSEYMKQQDIDFLFQHLQKRLTSWWD